MLVELVMTVCLAASGADCHDEHLVLEFAGAQAQCVIQSPIHVAQWSDSHPGWRVKRWKCVVPGSDGHTI